MKSTFVRKAAAKRQTLPQGTKQSVHNGQILVSSGLHDLDVLLGGGLPLGTLICLQEDEHSQYCQTLLKYFISEGISCKHANLICAPFSCPSAAHATDYLPFNHSIFQLTQPKEAEAQQQQQQAKEMNAKPDLKIAWRYNEFVEQQQLLSKQKQEASLQALAQLRQQGDEKMPVKKTNVASTGAVPCHEYDLSKTIQAQVLQDAKLCIVDMQEAFAQDNIYSYLFGKINHAIQESKTCYTLPENHAGVVRIALQSLGTPILNSNWQQVCSFLYALKMVLRSSLAICLFTVPKDSPALSMVQHLSDIVLGMQSFVGSHVDVSAYEFKEYTGFFNLVKLPRLNSLTVNFAPDSLQYAFKMKKRKMYIEKMHMPPEESRDASNPKRPQYREGSVNDVIHAKNTTSDDDVLGCASSSVGVHTKSNTKKSLPSKKDLEF